MAVSQAEDGVFNTSISVFKEGISTSQFENWFITKLSEVYKPFGCKVLGKPKIRGWTGRFWHPDIVIQKDNSFAELSDIFIQILCSNVSSFSMNGQVEQSRRITKICSTRCVGV